jgi:hypothetical protein
MVRKFSPGSMPQTSDCLINVSAFTGCEFSLRSEQGRGAPCASGKAVWTWPPVVAVDAGPMQIQSWEVAALSRAEAVLQGTTHNTVRAEIGYGEKVSRRLWSKKLEEGIALAASHRDAQRPEGRRVFGLERVVSCRSADLWWRTKLDFSSGEPFDDLHRSTAFRAAPKVGTIFGGRGVLFGLRLSCRTQQLKAERQECGAFAVGQEAEVTDAHKTLRKDVQ